MKKRKKLKLVLIGVLAVLVIIQFYRPDRPTTDEITSDDITNQMVVPDNVQSILKRSCYDCHSNHTFWPWYSNIAPVSWLVTYDVNEGKHNMNFSEWGKLSPSKREKKLADICDIITEGEMPLGKYLILHAGAKLSPEDKDVLCKWVEANNPDYEGDDEDK